MNNTELEIKTNKLLNGETVSYAITAFFSVFLLTAIKQIFKIFVGLEASVSCLIGFIVATVISYLLEKRFVFHKKTLSSTLKQLIMLVLRGGVNYGFYRLALFCFTDMLEMPDTFSWMLAIIMAVLFNYFFDRTMLFDCDYEASSVRKSKIYILFYKNKCIVLSALFALLAISIIFLIFSVFPFGDNTVMRMDLYHQYGPLFAELYERIASHKSLIYSWTSGGGSSFLGNYFNYLASPFSALIFLFDKENISFAITFIVIVKCVLSSASFSYYLSRKFNKADIFVSAYGVMYAFCAYFLAYYWNIMWLDAMFILPLIALGIERIITQKSPWLYMLTLAYMLFSNYYMGYMICIFAVIYFLIFFCMSPAKYKAALNPDFHTDKKYSFKTLMNNGFFNSSVKFAVLSIAAACLCAFALIPVYFILKGSSATSNSFPSSFSSYFPIFDFVTSHFAAMKETIRSSGDDVLPNVYSGVLSIVLLPLFVVNRKISFKEKAGYITLLLMMLFFFDNNCANFIWHGFHFPNDLPYRFSFMYSFVLLVIGYKTLTRLKGINIKDIAYSGLAWVFFILVAQKLTNTKMNEYTIYITLAFVILWTGFLMLIRLGKINGSLKSTMIIVFLFCEIVASDSFVIKITQSNEDYKKDYDAYTEAIDYIKENNDSFFRTELCYLNTRMDPCYYGYDGISTFSSMAYETYSELQKNLGMFGNRINSYTYNPQTPVYNMMFNLKYLIQTDVSLSLSESLYEKIYTTSDETSNVYENKYYLPISYCISADTDEWITDNDNPFDAQSDFIKLATGLNKEIFVEPEFISTDFDELTGDDVNCNGNYWISKSAADLTYGVCDIKVSPKTNGNFYIYVSSPDVKTIEVNSDKVASHVQTIDEPYILDIGYHNKGDEITITIDGGSMEDTADSYFNIYAYSLDENAFANAYDYLKSTAIEVTDYSDTKITGKINCRENSYLYSSIPYDEGWSVYIDGKKCETFELGGAMLTTTIKPGEHEVVYKYTPNGLSYGLIISAITVIALCGYSLYDKKITKSGCRKKEEIVD